MRWFVVLLAMTVGATPAAFEAVRNGDMAGLARALDEGASANAVEDGGQTLLIHAAAFLPVEGVRLLTDRGANVNLAGKGGGTALMAGCGDMAKVRLLVERGAEVNTRSTGGHTALGQALTLPAGRGIVLYLLSLTGMVKTLAFRRRLQLGAPRNKLGGWESIDTARTRCTRSTCTWSGQRSTGRRC